MLTGEAGAAGTGAAMTGALRGAITAAAGMLTGRSGTFAGGVALAAGFAAGGVSFATLRDCRRRPWDINPKPARNDSNCRLVWELSCCQAEMHCCSASTFSNQRGVAMPDLSSSRHTSTGLDSSIAWRNWLTTSLESSAAREAKKMTATAAETLRSRASWFSSAESLGCGNGPGCPHCNPYSSSSTEIHGHTLSVS